MAISLTESAAKHVQNFLAKRGKGVGLRLGVRTSGCSGMAYKLEFADEADEDDYKFWLIPKACRILTAWNWITRARD